MSSSSFRSYSKSSTRNSLRKLNVNRWLSPTCINIFKSIPRITCLNTLKRLAKDLTNTVIRLFRRTYFQSVHVSQMKLGKTNFQYKDHHNRMFLVLINRWIRNQIHQMVPIQLYFGTQLARPSNLMIIKSIKLAVIITCFNMIPLNLIKRRCPK